MTALAPALPGAVLLAACGLLVGSAVHVAWAVLGPAAGAADHLAGRLPGAAILLVVGLGGWAVARRRTGLDR